MASVRRSADRRLLGCQYSSRGDADYRCPMEKPRLDGRARATSISIESLRRTLHASARLGGPPPK